jgi:[acyl-carrier-protein] S-malonyltransferase
VRWVEVVQAMAAAGVTHVAECGPGKVLAGLTKRIDGSLQGLAIADAASLDQALQALGAST